jgi:hypothetical protein
VKSDTSPPFAFVSCIGDSFDRNLPMKNPFRHRPLKNRRAIVRAEIEHRRLVRMSRSLCTRPYFQLQ